jgi:hypothetical protein
MGAPWLPMPMNPTAVPGGAVAPLITSAKQTAGRRRRADGAAFFVGNDGEDMKRVENCAYDRRMSGAVHRAATRRVAPLLAWLGLLLGLIAAMVAAGRGSLVGPALADPASWSDWAARVGAPAAALSVVRLVVLALVVWLLAVTIVSFGLAATRRGREVEVSELLGLPIVRRVVHGALGLGLAGAAAAGGAGLGGGGGAVRVATPPPITVDARPWPSPSTSTPTSTTAATSSATSSATSTETPSPSPSSTTTSSSPPVDTTVPIGASIVTATTVTIPLTVPDPGLIVTATTAAPAAPLAGPPGGTAPSPVASDASGPPASGVGEPATSPTRDPGGAVGRTWVVRPGEHLWSIARRVVEDATGQPASEAAIAPYWETLVAANRTRMPVPANPDLLFPGDRLVVPPIPSGR